MLCYKKKEMSEKKINILYVEDDDGHALLMKLNLTDLKIDYSLKIFRYSDELFSFLNQNYTNRSIYFILLDIRLPKHNGLTILKMLKESYNFKNINVIIVSSSDNPEEIKQAFDGGAIEFYKKPVNFEKLKKLIISNTKNFKK
ncbi:MAG: hypothetical protein A2046_14065 [Bacteroidetes bacterium GWA2_30_7]|nr:MAG: hypothetical protein A2046_14065 [Bacteroidetes bacterium GWA2_30_7]